MPPTTWPLNRIGRPPVRPVTALPVAAAMAGRTASGIAEDGAPMEAAVRALLLALSRLSTLAPVMRRLARSVQLASTITIHCG